MKGVFAAAAIVLATLWMIVAETRRRLRRRPARRPGLLASAIAALVAGAIVAFWLPPRIPETPGSPATMVGMLLAWLMGGGLLLIGLGTLLGILTTRRAPADAAGARPDVDRQP